MKCNTKELADLSSGKGTIEGRLHHKKCNAGYTHSVFKEKWFKLRANILFYYHLSETGQIFDKKPLGAYILENVIVQYEMNSEVPFSFSFYFHDEVEKKHLFAGRSQESVNKWVEALKQASYEYWRSQLILLQEKLKLMTGQDPLLMYPRNKGCKNVLEAIAAKKCPEISENPSSQFYIFKEDKLEETKDSELILLKKTVDKELKEPKAETSNNDIQIPKRPPRANKTKENVECAKLIDI